jgi:glycosyltransferase involved in cell wall biosynthesis
MTQRPILFASHEASASGAPFLLLHLLRWLRTNTKLDFKIVLGRSGPLEAQFAELAPVTTLRRSTLPYPDGLVEELMPYRAAIALNKAKLRYGLGTEQLALVYSNTLVNGTLLRCLPDQSCPLISHVHELEHVIRRGTTPVELAYTLGRTRHFIAASAAVAANLLENHGIDDGRVNVVHEFIPSVSLDRACLKESAKRLRAELGIAERAIVVGGAGSVDWRKGYDLFLMAALEVLGKGRQDDIHFVWVGGTEERKIPLQLAYDIRRLGLEKRIHFVGYQRNPFEYMATFDMFCLTSREDPFPLVMLECAALGKPVICFDKSGGGPEFVSGGCGFTVPYMDVSAMAERILQLVEDPVLRRALGDCGETRVRENHDVNVVAPRIVEIIERSTAR